MAFFLQPAGQWLPSVAPLGRLRLAELARVAGYCFLDRAASDLEFGKVQTLERQLAEWIAHRTLLRQGDRIGVAVSGGADSTALLLLLHALAADHGWQLSVVHYDHGWRPDSGDDATWVGELAARLHLPFHLGNGAALPPRANREQVARRDRHAFFHHLIATGQADCIATGHTQDDQAETVLLRLLRGAGPAGLRGILPSRSLVAGAPPGSPPGPPLGLIVRPLLGLSRSALRSWLEDRGQSWREDPTNLDLSLRRNWVRRELLPMLQGEFNPAIAHGLATLAEVMRAEEEYWAQVTTPLADKLWRVEGHQLIASRTQLQAYPLALQRRLLREGVRRLRGDLLRLQFHHVEVVVQALCLAPRPPRQFLLAGVICHLNARSLRLVRPNAL